MPRGEGKDKCRCVPCSTMDENPGLSDEVFTNVMQSVWGPVEVEALVTTETFRVMGGKHDQDDSTT